MKKQLKRLIKRLHKERKKSGDNPKGEISIAGMFKRYKRKKNEIKKLI